MLRLENWIEMKDWPALWDLDFGFAPIGAHKINASMVWYFNEMSMVADSWSQASKHSIYNAQIAAALARLHRIPHVTIQIRGVDVWIHSDQSFQGGYPPQQFNATLFKESPLLIVNLGDAVKFVIHAEWIDPVSFHDDTAPNLQMLLTKFDIN